MMKVSRKGKLFFSALHGGRPRSPEPVHPQALEYLHSTRACGTSCEFAPIWLDLSCYCSQDGYTLGYQDGGTLSCDGEYLPRT